MTNASGARIRVTRDGSTGAPLRSLRLGLPSEPIPFYKSFWLPQPLPVYSTKARIVRLLTLILILMFTVGAHAERINVTFDIPSRFPEPIVTGRTNLPDGTELLITIQRPFTSQKPPPCVPICMAQSKAVVRNGQFHSERFGIGLGTFMLDITTGAGSSQPPDIRAIIGDRSENLTGPYLRPQRRNALSASPSLSPELNAQFGPMIQYDSTIVFDHD